MYQPNVVCPSAARCGEEYASWIGVPTTTQLRWHVLISAMLCFMILFLTDMMDFKGQRIYITFCFNLKELLHKCYRVMSQIKNFVIQMPKGENNIVNDDQHFFDMLNTENYSESSWGYLQIAGEQFQMFIRQQDSHTGQFNAFCKTTKALDTFLHNLCQDV